MKNIFALCFVASFSSQAITTTTTIQFVGAGTTNEGNLCVVAAKSGVQSVKKMTRDNAESTLCNNESTYKFATKYQRLAPKTLAAINTTTYAKTFEFVPANDNNESRICTIAAQQGFKAAAEQAGEMVENLYCNGSSVRSFAKRYANT